MRIDTSKIKDKMIVHCNTEEKAKVLCKVLKTNEEFWTNWRDHKEKTCFRKDGWATFYSCLEHYLDKKNSDYKNYPFIEFDDLLLPERSKLAEILGVEDNEEFEFEGKFYKISNKRLHVKDVAIRGLESLSLMIIWDNGIPSGTLMHLIDNMDKIIRLPKPPKYSLGTIKKAKAATELYGEDWWVARDKGGKIFIYSKAPEKGYTGKYFMSIPSGITCTIEDWLFPEVTFENSPVQLKEIVVSEVSE